MGDHVPPGEWIIALLGVVIAMTSAVISLYAFHEKWIQYRIACETGRRRKSLFLTRFFAYDDKDAFAIFVQNIDGLLSQENGQSARYAAATVAKEHG